MGQAECHLFPAAELTAFAVAWLEERFGCDLTAEDPPPPPRAIRSRGIVVVDGAAREIARVRALHTCIAMDLDLSDHHELLRRTVREFAEGEVAPVAGELDRTHSVPYEIIAKLGALNLMGIPFPEEYGGARRRHARLHADGRGAHARRLVGRDHALRAHVARHAADLPLRHRGAAPRVDAAAVLRRDPRRVRADRGRGRLGRRATRRRARRADDGEGWVIDGAKQFITNAGTDISGLVTITALHGRPARSRTSSCPTARPATSRASRIARWAGTPPTRVR